MLLPGVCRTSCASARSIVSCRGDCASSLCPQIPHAPAPTFGVSDLGNGEQASKLARQQQISDDAHCFGNLTQELLDCLRAFLAYLAFPCLPVFVFGGDPCFHRFEDCPCFFEPFPFLSNDVGSSTERSVLII